MPFGQLVIGSPGSGKTTYCHGMQQYLGLLGRKVAVINLDPANDNLPYDCKVDISDLVTLQAVQEELKLGPNGGLIYCMDYLAENLDWLEARLKPLAAEDYYFLFDCPGQVELFTLSASFKNISNWLSDTSHYRCAFLPREQSLVAVLLVDSHLCSDPAKYIAASLLSLTAMLHVELPHINVLSKADMLEAYGPLAFNLDFYTEVPGLSHIIHYMGDDAFSKRFRKLSEGICEVIDDFGLLSFALLAIEDKDRMQRIVNLVDKANGYVWAGRAEVVPYPEEPLPEAELRSRGIRVEEPD